jgi:hypothetical protein
VGSSRFRLAQLLGNLANTAPFTATNYNSQGAVCDWEGAANIFASIGLMGCGGALGGTSLLCGRCSHARDTCVAFCEGTLFFGVWLKQGARPRLARVVKKGRLMAGLYIHANFNAPALERRG